MGGLKGITCEDRVLGTLAGIGLLGVVGYICCPPITEFGIGLEFPFVDPLPESIFDSPLSIPAAR